MEPSRGEGSRSCSKGSTPSRRPPSTGARKPPQWEEWGRVFTLSAIPWAPGPECVTKARLQRGSDYSRKAEGGLLRGSRRAPPGRNPPPGRRGSVPGEGKVCQNPVLAGPPRNCPLGSRSRVGLAARAMARFPAQSRGSIAFASLGNARPRKGCVMDEPTNLYWPHFSEAEYARRDARIRAAMREEGLGALIVYGVGGLIGTDPHQANVVYIARYAAFTQTYVVFPLDGEPTLFIPWD